MELNLYFSGQEIMGVVRFFRHRTVESESQVSIIFFCFHVTQTENLTQDPINSATLKVIAKPIDETMSHPTWTALPYTLTNTITKTNHKILLKQSVCT